MFLISPKHDTTAERLPLLQHLTSDWPAQDHQSCYWLSVTWQQRQELTCHCCWLTAAVAGANRAPPLPNVETIKRFFLIITSGR